MTREVQPCGTNAGYYRHRNHGEQVCDDCRNAHRVYMNMWNRGGPKRPRSEARCGTTAGYLRHWRNKQDACAACLEARAAYGQERRAALKEAS